MNIRIRKKQIRRKLAAGYPISHNEMKFGIKHKMTDSVFHNPFELIVFSGRKAGISASKAKKRLETIAIQTGNTIEEIYSEFMSGLRKGD